MVLEATMIVIDNSEWMINGDYIPTRFEAQKDAMHLIFNQKINDNPENMCGLMTIGDNSPQVLCTLTRDYGKLLSAIHDLPVRGEAKLMTGIQIAQLALKHRENKTQRQRIVVFLGSPVDSDEKNMKRLAKKLKKNNVAVDIVHFGELSQENTDKLSQFIETVNSNDNSHLVTIPQSDRLLSDMVNESPIGQGVAASNSQFEFGVDPTLDPELALALELSMAEERARQDNQNRDTGANPSTAATTTTTTTQEKPSSSNADEKMKE